ncbi:MAG: zinc ribbon domain-containing protein [Anaerocolumna sp.]
MFFIIGISCAKKRLDFVQTMLCSKCSQFGRFELFMTYSYLSLFFLPVFKWNKKFYAITSCCGVIYSIGAEIGKRILKGEPITLTEQDLHLINNGFQNTKSHPCLNCGYISESDFLYCPKCGNRL